jgi:hypothetical protein
VPSLLTSEKYSFFITDFFLKKILDTDKTKKKAFYCLKIEKSGIQIIPNTEHILNSSIGKALFYGFVSTLGRVIAFIAKTLTRINSFVWVQ